MTDPDRRLAGRARRGDRRALVELYRRHRGALLGFLVRNLGDRELAEDTFQEVWVKVLRNVEHYRQGIGTFRAWLFRIASNAAVDRRRREMRHRVDELDAPAGESEERQVNLLPSSDPGPGRVVEGRLRAEALAAAMRRLSERQQAAVLLRHQQGLSYAEIASALAVPEGTAKTLVHRGVLLLRERMRKSE